MHRNAGVTETPTPTVKKKKRCSHIYQLTLTNSSNFTKTWMHSRLCIALLVFQIDICHAAVFCNSSAFCPSSTPFCLSYGTNYSLNAWSKQQSSQQNVYVTSDTAAVLSFTEGICVECLGDCDCGVSQYCGIDPDPNSRVTFPGISLSSLPSISTSNNFTQVKPADCGITAQTHKSLNRKCGLSWKKW